MAIRRTDALVGTLAEWLATTGPIPDGQLVIETTNNTLKMGDGTSRWVDLDEIGTGGSMPSVLDGGAP